MVDSVYILGISAYYHDSAAVILLNGEILAAAQEERFTRNKHDSNFPKNAIEYCLREAGICLSDLDSVVFYDKPFLKFERLIETYYNFAPRGFASFVKAMPVWLKDKIFLKKIIKDELAKVSDEKTKFKLKFSEHHLSHAASAFYPSPFERAAILTIDGVGEWATATISRGAENQIKILRELHFPHSVGMLYSAFTYFLGFKVNSGEYKLMGLAPYGNANSQRVNKFKEIITDQLVDIKDDGSIWMNQKYFSYCSGLKMTNNSRWKELFGFSNRAPEEEILQEHCDLALAIQIVTEEIVMKMATFAAKLTGCKNLCLAGGVALNCVANGKLLRSGIFEKVWIQPAAGDAGGALGAAYTEHYIAENNKRSISKLDDMQGSYLGPSFGVNEINKTIIKYEAESIIYKDFDGLCSDVAESLSEGLVVGWFQGRAEWGPRALGNRSILGDARSEEMQKKLNLKVKFRESFRPFAPSVLEEDMEEHFEVGDASPYMLLVGDIQKDRQKKLPENYADLPMREKLYFVRSDLPAITHLDYSARVQSVSKKTNPKYHQLISKFKEITGVPVVVNTSFNVRGEPIVLTPEDAYRCFMRTEMDVLVVENHVFHKSDQPEWKEKDDWKTEFVLD